jgi:hypothetical protein
MAKTAFLFYLSILSHTTFSQAVCSRQQLQAVSDAFVKHGGAASQKYTPNAKISVNNKFVKDISDTIFSKVEGLGRNFRLDAIDEATCNFGTFAFVKTSTSNSTLISVRAKLETSGAITEVEVIDTSSGRGFGGKGGGSGGGKGRSPLTPPEVTQLWKEPIVKGSSALPSRDQLLAILDTYPAGIQAGTAKNVQTSKGCMRIENDMLNVQCAVAYEALKFPVTNRAYFPDMKTGISLTKFYFDQEKKGGMMAAMGNLWIHEYMKITDGKIQEIRAAFITFPSGKGQSAPFKDVFITK